MSEIQFGNNPDLTENKFGLQCLVKLYRKSAKQGVQGGISEYEAILLIPRDTTQRTKFFKAWLPEMQDEHFEVPVYINSPINSPCRCSIHRADERSPCEHYLFVMSKGCEDALKKHVGKILLVEAQPASQDSDADGAIDSDTPIDVIE